MPSWSKRENQGSILGIALMTRRKLIHKNNANNNSHTGAKMKHPPV
jgi:hypothetical protein